MSCLRGGEDRRGQTWGIPDSSGLWNAPIAIGWVRAITVYNSMIVLIFVWLSGTEPKSCRKDRQFKRFLISVLFRYPQKRPSKRWLGYRTSSDDRSSPSARIVGQFQTLVQKSCFHSTGAEFPVEMNHSFVLLASGICGSTGACRQRAFCTRVGGSRRGASWYRVPDRCLESIIVRTLGRPRRKR